ncbi:protein adenylyltransferase SelO family protein [Dyella nitratireducens]|uniref:MchC protein n=1 Tax=Dyella nitratireducens TaxID=1849580 RepID=A0ABQ1GN33_9GAMM|nr:protein adenylyltransferase SelO family protein [Dyella nitratireducens]GGA47142.1 hypothetical protein GCM10010981_40420 [Dyella nitratireducens]GLQ41544.1 hypothetical protein GCM10007902_13940 [Dyella nitratireducens]
MSSLYKDFWREKIVDVGLMSPNVLVDFDAGILPNARVVWLNKRWFFSAGIDLNNPSVEQDVGQWLLSTYAVSSVEELCSSGSFGTTKLGADRYGASGGASHGGSGRCGHAGLFNAKGVGRTPLVSPNVDWAHSHGCLYLFEAIREAIASEIALAEMPHGATSVIAIIDAGFSLRSDKDSEPERCAILVRPNFVRLAHFERSVFFGTSGFKGSDQYQDSLRVKDAIGAITRDTTFQLPNTLVKLAEQVAASRAHRLWAGRPTTDNVTMDGAFLDFGNFRSLPNWKRANDSRGQVFGTEMQDLENAVTSLAHFFIKHSALDPGLTPAQLTKMIRVRLDDAFRSMCISACALPAGESIASTLSDLVSSYYQLQQRSSYLLCEPSPTWGRKDWLYYEMGPLTDEPNVRHTEKTYGQAIRSLILGNGRSRDGLIPYAAARRWTAPRHQQNYHVSRHHAKRVVTQIIKAGSGARDVLSRYISSEIAMSRRIWPKLDPSHIILGFATDVASSVVFTYDTAENAYTAILSGIQINDTLRLFGTEIPVSNDAFKEAFEIEITSRYQPSKLSSRQSVSVFGKMIEIPSPMVTFADGLTAASKIEQCGGSTRG